MAGAQRQISIPAGEISIPQIHPLRNIQWLSAIVGIVALTASILLGMNNQPRFFFSYLVAFLFVTTLALGCLAFVLIQFLTRAGWSVAVRRLAENAMSTFPVIALLAIPLIPGLPILYPWFSSEAILGDKLLEAKSSYLNPTFFSLRALVFLASWSLIALWFRKLSLKQDKEGGPKLTRRLQTLSAPAMVWFGISVNFAAFDWGMSLDPHWYSTIYGVYLFAGAFVSALALLFVVLLFLQRTQVLTNLVTQEHYHDLGKLLFGFVVFWAYIAFSQFMLIWYANIPEETVWYAHRLSHGWEYATIFLALGHFVFPFFFLLPVATKRNRVALWIVSIWILFIHYFDLYWLVMPNLSEGFHPHIIDGLTLVALTSIFIAALSRRLLQANLIPVNDPRLAESLSFENI